MKVEILMSPGCGHGRQTVERVAELLRETGLHAVVETTIVDSEAEAARRDFPGSPTVRVDGADIDAEAPSRVSLG